MHKTTVPYITKENAEGFIKEFLKDFKKCYPNVRLKMLVVGGSALAIKHSMRGTVDIDAEIRSEKGIEKLIKQTARRLGIFDDFINEDFMKSDSYSRYLWSDAVNIYKDDYFEVFVVSDLSQLCMKLTTFRNKDYGDVKYLTAKLVENGYRYSQVLVRIDELYKGTVRVHNSWLRYVEKCFKRAKLL